jgi:autotransporter-associated beta strand protein
LGGIYQVSNSDTIEGISQEGQVNITNDNTLTLRGQTGHEFQGTIIGAGNLEKAGAGTQTLSSNANTYSGTTSIKGGKLRLNLGASIANSRVVSIDSAGTLELNVLDKEDAAAKVSTTSIKALTGTGSVLLNSKSLAITGTAGRIPGGGNFGGVISGKGGLIVDLNQTGPTGGLFTLSGANTYTGATTVNSGTLAINGKITSPTTVNSGATLQGTGAIDGDVVNEGIVSPGNSIGTLTARNFAQRAGATLLIEVNGSDSDLLSITGAVSDLNGKVTIAGQPTPGKVYTGITAGAQYTGSSTANADTGSAIVATSFRLVRGQDQDFNKLNGSPTYDPTKLQFGWIQKDPKGSTLPVNTAPGKATIKAVQQTGGAITATITQPAAQSTAQCDANTGNSAACNNVVNGGGTSGASAANANNVEKAKAIDAGMTSVFSAVNTGVTGGAPIPSSTGAPTGYTTNQAKAARVTPDFVTVYSALLTLPTVGQVNQTLHAISAEPYASMQSVALEAMEQFRANTLALSSGSKAIPFIAEEQVCQVEPGTNTDPNQAPPADCKPRTVQKLTPWSLLIDGTNTQASLNGTNDLASLDYNIFSSSYGLQYDFSRQWSAGAAFGYGRANLYNYEYANVRIDSSTYAGSVWGTYRPSAPWKLTALAGYMNLQYDSDRAINFGGLNRTANANWSGNGFTTALAAEYEWVLANDKTSRSAVRIKPNTFLSYALHNQGSFSESGAGALNLAVDSHTADSLLYGIGFQIETPIITGKTSRLIPRLSLGYEYDFNGDTNEEHQLTASFAEVPALGSVDVLGQNRGSNALDVGLSLEYETSEKLSLYAGVGGAFWSNGNELSYGGGMRLRW